MCLRWYFVSTEDPYLFPTVDGNHSDLFAGEEDESRYTGPNALQLLKALPMKPYSPPSIATLMKQVLCDLLNALAAPSEPPPTEGKCSLHVLAGWLAG